MRLFAALPIPTPAQEEVAAFLHGLAALGWPVRWVSEEGLHLTLKFFGEVTPDRLDAIAEMLGFSVDGVGSIPLSVVGGGAFPDRHHPRVLRLDLSRHPSLDLLQDRVERGADRIGFPPEGRPFQPHVTLGRVREGHRLPAGAMERLEAVPATSSFHADRVVLFESCPGRRGPTYEARSEFVLP